MTLRERTLGIVTATLVGLIVILFFSMSEIVLRSFAELEEDDIRRNVLRVEEALAMQLGQMNISARDYAPADLSLETLIDLLDSRAAQRTTGGKNGLADLLGDLELNALLLAYSKGRIIWSQGYD